MQAVTIFYSANNIENTTPTACHKPPNVQAANILNKAANKNLIGSWLCWFVDNIKVRDKCQTPKTDAYNNINAIKNPLKGKRPWVQMFSISGAVRYKTIEMDIDIATPIADARLYTAFTLDSKC